MTITNKITTKLSKLKRYYQYFIIYFLFKFKLKRSIGTYIFNNLKVAYTDFNSFFMEYKDIFLHGIYDFESSTPTPFILDGGGCIGMSTLFFKSKYPDSKIVVFEPDLSIAKILNSNIKQNNINNVDIVVAGLSDKCGQASFVADGVDGGRIMENETCKEKIVTVVLSNYITKPVDFLKLNIEGNELIVLEELERTNKLKKIDQLVIEYHGWPSGSQDLDKILAILDRNNFRYMLHDFDHLTNKATKPPFRYNKSKTWFNLIYAKNISFS